MNKKNVIVIGSGLGGLSAAISLAQEGYAVTIHEKNAKIGGKLSVLKERGTALTSAHPSSRCRTSSVGCSSARVSR